MTVAKLLLDSNILLSDVATGFAFLSVIRRLRSTSSAEGLSLQTLIAAASIRCLHLLSYHLGLHYAPAVLPRVLFMASDCGTALAAVLALLLFLAHIGTYESRKDTFGAQLFEKYDLPKSGPWRHRGLRSASCFYAIVIIVAFVWHHVRRLAVHDDAYLVLAHHNHSYYLSFYETLSALCLIPQLWMFHQHKRVPPLLANFVLFFAVHKVLVLVFWVVYPSVEGKTPPNRSIQMAFDALSLLILSDFIFYWCRSKLHGYPDVVLDFDLELPVTDTSIDVPLG